MLTSLFNLIFCSLFFFFFLQSKHKEDTSITRPILLDEPKFEIHLLSFLLPSSFFFFFFARVSFATFFCLSHLPKSSFDLHILFLFLFLFIYLFIFVF